ncbi:MAG: hypothetical protein Q9201_004801 [Fulgogasparrea decipioides]
MFRFCELSMSRLPPYSHVVASLKDDRSSRQLLDLGCCFAQEIRKLVHDGAPSENLYACDINRQFLDLGYELFRDRHTLDSHMIAADMFQDDGPLSELEGKMNFIHASFLLHLFGWEKQVYACKRMIKLLQPVPGAMVFGKQTANSTGQNVYHQATGRMWRHDEKSFKAMWELVGQQTETCWNVSTMFKQWEGMNFGEWTEPGFGYLIFEVRKK